jgi:hypothetical protein
VNVSGATQGAAGKHGDEIPAAPDGAADFPLPVLAGQQVAVGCPRHHAGRLLQIVVKSPGDFGIFEGVTDEHAHGGPPVDEGFIDSGVITPICSIGKRSCDTGRISGCRRKQNAGGSRTRPPASLSFVLPGSDLRQVGGLGHFASLFRAERLDPRIVFPGGFGMIRAETRFLEQVDAFLLPKTRVFGAKDIQPYVLMTVRHGRLLSRGWPYGYRQTPAIYS